MHKIIANVFVLQGIAKSFDLSLKESLTQLWEEVGEGGSLFEGYSALCYMDKYRMSMNMVGFTISTFRENN